MPVRSIASATAATAKLLANSEFRCLIYGGAGFQRHFFQFSHSQDYKMRRLFPLVLAVVSLSLLIGCSGEDSGPPVYPVTGKVTLDGQILADATIQVCPEKGPMATARTDDKGEYTLSVIAGKHKVTVSKVAAGSKATEVLDENGVVVAGSVAEEINESTTVSVLLVPEIYGSLNTTTLSVTVEENEDPPNDGNLDLSSS